MGRVIGAVLITAVIALAAGWLLWGRIAAQADADRAATQAQIAQLEQQRIQLQAQNDQLRTELNKVQAEEERLSTVNNELAEALEKARLTGKIPPPNALPYPPK